VTAFVGTSGWQYKHWRGPFYPLRPRVKDELAFYAERFRTVELNASFYHLPAAETFSDWAARVPEDFIFAVKASRYLTHIKQLRDPEEPVQRLLDRAGCLGAKLGPVLLQLPPALQEDTGRLRAALAAFPRQVRVAVEFRHESWFTAEIRSLLEEFGAALCLADRRAEWQTPCWRTADWGYVRFHGGLGEPFTCYEPQTLATRAETIERLWGDADAYAYFNNDPHGCAVRDARSFAAVLAEHGPALRAARGRTQEHSITSCSSY
jgi:uncharacterized protein YecE (DUF72 family)